MQLMLKVETELYVFAELHGTCNRVSAMFNHQIKTKLPEKDIDTTVRTKDKHVKNKMKEYMQTRGEEQKLHEFKSGIQF